MWLVSLVLFLLLVGFSGWLSGKLIYGKGLGLVINVGSGLFGFFLSYTVLGLFGIQVVSFTGMFFASTAGATVILALIKTLGRASTRALSLAKHE